KRDAEDWVRETELAISRGTYSTPGKATGKLSLTDALDKYLKEVSAKKKPSTERNEKGYAANIRIKLGKFALTRITPEIVAKYRDHRLQEGMAANSVRLELALLSHLYNTAAAEWGLNFPNPVSNVKKPSAQARSRRVTPEEECKLLEEIGKLSNPTLLRIFLIAVETSMRKSEIQKLRIPQVDLDRRIIRLSSSETKNEEARTVPLTKRAAQILKEAIEDTTREIPGKTDYIFPGEPGRDGRRRPYEFNKTWTTLLKKIGIEDLHFHDLRHEAISRLFERSTLRDGEIAAISGHKTMQMLKRYTHLRNEDLVKKLDEMG
ncbi:MAG: tyrosine-type recombinase/integrase, partial [Burkholderiales bacterium]